MKMEITEQMIETIEDTIKDLNTLSWDAIACETLCRLGEPGNVSEDCDYWEGELLSRIRLIKRGIEGLGDDISDIISSLKSLLPNKEEVTA